MSSIAASCAETGRHSRRVAAFATELASVLGLSDADRNVLRRAAEYHDVPVGLFEPRAMNRLIADVTGFELPGAADSHIVSPQVREVLRALQGGEVTSEAVRLAGILEIADALDEAIEAGPYSAGGGQEDDPSADPFSGAALSQLRCASLEDLHRVMPRLPVFPAAALRATLTLIKPEVDNRELERIGASDPVLAGRLLNAANSVIFSPRDQIRTVPQAISYVGVAAARNIILAAISHPLFAPGYMRATWKHSLECAEIATAIAELTSAAPPAEALLAGLMHDIGTLAMWVLRSDAVSRCKRLIAEGCPIRCAEEVVYGFDHATAGAEVAAHWRFPPDLVDAIRWHHLPERSENTLASLIYVAEFWTCSDEDVPSTARLNTALAKLRLSVEDLARCRYQSVLSRTFG